MAPLGCTLLLTDGDQSAIVSLAALVQAITTGIAEMAEGSIKRLTDRGFGFIDTGTGKDLFFHSSSVQGASFDELHEGQKVSYTEGRGPKGPCAENVKPV
jgi:CspA family cold shock protein